MSSGGAMASSSSGAPSVRDVRRARAARFSFSPAAQEFGSPTFSLGLEKFPSPPAFDRFDGEKDQPKSVEKQISKRVRLSDDKAAPSFSLGIEDIQGPGETPDTSGQGEQTREVQQSPYPSGEDEFSDPDPRKVAEDCRNSRGRASKVFAGPSFSLGLERISLSAESDEAHCLKQKHASDRLRVYGDGSIYLSSRQFRGEEPSATKARLLGKSADDHWKILERAPLEDSPHGNSHSPKRSGEMKLKHRKLQSDILPRSPSFDQKTECSAQPGSSVRDCEEEEQTSKQSRRFGRIPSSPKLGPPHVKSEPTSDSDVTRADDQGIPEKSDGAENTSPPTRRTSLTLGSELSSGSGEDQILERKTIEDGPSSSFGDKLSPESEGEGFAANRLSSNGRELKLDRLLQCSPDHRVGLVVKKEEPQECECNLRVNLLSSLPHMSYPPHIVLSQEEDEKRSLEQRKLTLVFSADTQSTRENKIPVENFEEQEAVGQRAQKEIVDVIDVSTPPSLKVGPKRHRERSALEVVEDSEEELTNDEIRKRRRLSKLITQVKAETTSADHSEDFSCSPIESLSVAVGRTPRSPAAEQKKIFKRLRRASINQTSQVGMDRSAVLKKRKVELSDPPFHVNKLIQPSFNDVKDQTTDNSQHTNQDEFDDIEDFSECELACTGSRPHKDRRSLQIHIQPKELSLSTPPAGGRKPVLHIPGLDASVISKTPDQAKAESFSCLEARFSSSTITKKHGSVRAEPITLSDDEEPWPIRPKIHCSQTRPPEDLRGSVSLFEKQKLVPESGRAGKSPVLAGSVPSWKGKSPVMDGSDLWKSFTEEFSRDISEGPADGFACASNYVYKKCQSDDTRITDLIRERLHNFKPVDSLLVDGGLDQEPVYIDYRNQFGHSQGMDSTGFAELDCTQPQTRRKQRRASKSTRGRKANASSSTISSQRTATSRRPEKGKRKAWTLFREPEGRASASTSISDKGYWIVDDGRKVYVKDGRTLTGRSAYAAYKRDSGRKSRKTKKKPASKVKR